MMRHAIHEAGHAVASRLYDRRIVFLTIDPDGESHGRIKTDRLLHDAEHVRQELVISAAGAAAEECLYPGTAITGGDAEDMQFLARKLVGMLASAEAVAAEIEAARQKAAALVARYWGEIESVANLLLQNHQMMTAINSSET